ncbi:hypothetical protein BD560DRAFT_381716 [Blakeslea trispora]|nr:hypothetical protein BD560DRAFT_381716 [Blakeslea trispora]
MQQASATELLVFIFLCNIIIRFSWPLNSISNEHVSLAIHLLLISLTSFYYQLLQLYLQSRQRH